MSAEAWTVLAVGLLLAGLLLAVLLRAARDRREGDS